MNQPYIHPQPQQPQVGSDSTPKETLYVTNLNDKIKIIDMKYCLYILFSQYGEILQIIIKKNNALRGQAFVVFSNVSQATNAKSALSGIAIFDKQMKIEFAKTRSQIFDQMEGKIYYKQPKQQKQKTQQINSETITEKKTNKINEKLQTTLPSKLFDNPDANNVIFADSLPAQISEDKLVVLFSQYPGFQAVRLIAARGIAFIEYDNEDQATIAMRGLNGFHLTSADDLRLQFARRNHE